MSEPLDQEIQNSLSNSNPGQINFILPPSLNSIIIWATVWIKSIVILLRIWILWVFSNPGQIIFRFLQAENSITVWATVCIDTVVNLLVLLNYMPHHTGWSIRAAAIAPHFILYLFCENVDGFLFKFWYHKLSTLFVQIITVVIR